MYRTKKKILIALNHIHFDIFSFIWTLKKNIDSDCVGCIVVSTALALAYVFVISYV